MSYPTVSTDDVLNTTTNETVFPEIAIFFKEHFEMKVQEVSVLKYSFFWICQSPLGFNVYQTDHITELVNECFLTEKFRKLYTPFRTDSAYEN